MPRRMADPLFQKQQWDDRYAPHAAPINHLVDELCHDHFRGWAPYVAPMYGGVKAKMLSILRDPGPATRDSRFLCIENDDSTAEAMYWLLEGVGIQAIDMVPWNAYPWYINQAPSAEQMNAGIEPLNSLVDLLPDLKVVVLHGGDARSIWQRYKRKHRQHVEELEKRVKIIQTYHTSRQAFWHADPDERVRRRQHLQTSLSEAAQEIRS